MLEYNICCRVYGAEQGTDHDQNGARKEMLEMLETQSVNLVMMETVVDLGILELGVATPGPLVLHSL